MHADCTDIGSQTGTQKAVITARPWGQKKSSQSRQLPLRCTPEIGPTQSINLPMRLHLTPLLALYFSASILLTGHGMQLGLVPLLAESEGFSGIDIGLMGSAYFAGYLAGCVFIPRFISWVGHVRVFLVLIAVATAALLSLTLDTSFILWFFSRSLVGFCLAGIYMVIESWLNEAATRENRGLILAVYTLITLAAIGLGQIFLTASMPYPKLMTLAAILLLLGAIPIGFSRSPSPQPIESFRLRYGSSFKRARVAFIGALSCGIVTSGYWSMGTFIAQSLGLSIESVIYFMIAPMIGGALVQIPVGRLSDSMDRRKVLLGLSLFAAGVSLIAILGPTDAWLFATLVMALFGAATFPLYAISLAHANDSSSFSVVQTASAILLTYSLGAVLGPILVSMGQIVTPKAMFWLTLIVMTPFAAWIMLRIQDHDPDRAHFEPFVVAPVSSPEVFQLSDQMEGANETHP